MSEDWIWRQVPCPECGFPMHRDGHHLSGKKRVQRWKCQRCGRTTIKGKP